MQKAWLLICIVLPLAFVSGARSDTTWHDPEQLQVVEVDNETLGIKKHGELIFTATGLDILQINLAIASALSLNKAIGIGEGARLLTVGEFAPGQFPIDLRCIIVEREAGMLTFSFQKNRFKILLHQNIPYVLRTQFQLDFQLGVKYHRSQGFLEVIVNGDSYNPEVNFVRDDRMSTLKPHVPITPKFYTRAQLQERNQLPFAHVVKEFVRIATQIVSL